MNLHWPRCLIELVSFHFKINKPSYFNWLKHSELNLQIFSLIMFRTINHQFRCFYYLSLTKFNNFFFLGEQLHYPLFIPLCCHYWKFYGKFFGLEFKSFLLGLPVSWFYCFQGFVGTLGHIVSLMRICFLEGCLNNSMLCCQPKIQECQLINQIQV